MSSRVQAVLAACEQIDRAIRSRLEFGHVSHLRVDLGTHVAVDRHYRGPLVADVSRSRNLSWPH